LSGNRTEGSCSKSPASREAPEARIDVVIYRIKTSVCPSAKVAEFQKGQSSSKPRTHGLDSRTETIWLKVAVKSS